MTYIEYSSNDIATNSSAQGGVSIFSIGSAHGDENMGTPTSISPREFEEGFLP